MCDRPRINAALRSLPRPPDHGARPSGISFSLAGQTPCRTLNPMIRPPDSPDADWRELACFDDLHQARAIATAIAAMEYEVRLIDARGGEVRPDLELAYNAPYALQVPAAERAELADVIDEIVAEQMEFDVRLAAFHDRASRRQRLFLAFMVALVIGLAILGVIRL